MMNYRQPDELNSELLHRQQIGDNSLVSKDGYVHLPNCSIYGGGYTRNGESICTCGAARQNLVEVTTTTGTPRNVA